MIAASWYRAYRQRHPLTLKDEIGPPDTAAQSRPSLHLLVSIAFGDQPAVDVGSLVIRSFRLRDLRGGNVAGLLSPALVYGGQTPFGTPSRSSDGLVAYQDEDRV